MTWKIYINILELTHQWHSYGNSKELYYKTTKEKHSEILTINYKVML